MAEIIERISKVEQKVSHQTDRINQLDTHQNELINQLGKSVFVLDAILDTRLGKIVAVDTLMIILTTILIVIKFIL